MNLSEKTEIIKKRALKIGFDDVGIVKADFLLSEKKHLKDWLNNGYNAEMDYMRHNYDKRLDVRKLVAGAKSVIVVLKNYYPKKLQPQESYQISKYAYGEDYHKVMKADLYNLLNFIKQEVDDKVSGRVFTDSAPVLERNLAKRAGLGWTGKNSMLLTQKGSYFFIGEIILTTELHSSNFEMKSFCGNCTRCIDACPANAIIKPFVVDSNKCISYLTIEKRGNFSSNIDLSNWIFGCDICQDVCPWNKFSFPTSDTRFKPHDLLLGLMKKDWQNFTEKEFNDIFAVSAVKRTKYAGLMRNITELRIKNREKGDS